MCFLMRCSCGSRLRCACYMLDSLHRVLQCIARRLSELAKRVSISGRRTWMSATVAHHRRSQSKRRSLHLNAHRCVPV
eukprot:IDg1803t1